MTDSAKPANAVGTQAAGAAQPGNAGSDFVNFYEVIGAPVDATTTNLRRRINELYSEAQSNRDHRNPAKRRQYEALCDLLPYCRIVLLDADKRMRYDAYMKQVEKGTATTDFETFINDVAGNDGEVTGENGEHSGFPGIAGDDVYLPTSTAASTPATPTPASTAQERPGPLPDSEALTLAGTAGHRKRVSRTAGESLLGTALSVTLFTALLVIGFLLLTITQPRMDTSHKLGWSLLPAALVGIAAWLITHRNLGKRVS